MDEKGEIVIYQSEDGLAKLNVNMRDDTVWLSLDQMAELFGRDKSTVSRHISNIFSEGELLRDSVVANFATTASDGKTYNVSEWCVIQKWEADYQRKHSGSNHTIDSGI